VLFVVQTLLIFALPTSRFSLRLFLRHPRAYERWTDDDHNRLTRQMNDKAPINEIARDLQRHPSAIRSRLAKLGLISPSE